MQKSRNPLLLIALVLLMAILVAACSGPAPTEDGTPVVFGTIWSDDNGNGYRDPGEDPVAGVTVRFIPSGGSEDDEVQETETNEDGEYIIEVSTDAKGEIIVEPEDQTFTKKDVGDDRLDSDVDQETGSASVSANDRIDAGLLPRAVAQVVTPTNTATTLPQATATATATVGPEPSATATATQEPEAQPETMVGSYFLCSDGSDVSPLTWSVEGPPEVEVDDTKVSILIKVINPPPDRQLFMGVDFAGQGLPLTGPNPEFILFEGTNVGFSVSPQGDAFAGQTIQNGDFLPLDTQVIGNFENDTYIIEIPVNELQAGLSTVRITLTDLEICWLNTQLSLNNGFPEAAEVDPALAELLASITVRRVCSTTGCFMHPEDVPFDPTGDGTGNLDIDGQSAAVQFIISPGEASNRAADFGAVGWIVEPNAEIAPDGPLPWQGFSMATGSGTLGLLGLADNGSSQNPQVAEFFMFGQNNLSEAELATWTSLMNVFLGTYRANPQFSQ